MSLEDPSTRVKITLLLVHEDYIRLKAEQARLSKKRPSPTSLSDMAHDQWLRKLGPAPKNFRVRKRKSGNVLSAAS